MRKRLINFFIVYKDNGKISLKWEGKLIIYKMDRVYVNILYKYLYNWLWISKEDK